MRHMQCLQKQYSAVDYNSNFHQLRVNALLTEDDILLLQDLFLTNGIHCIIAANVLSGRKLMYKFLQSLHYYHNVTCLTANKDRPLKKTVFNLFQSIQEYCGCNCEYQEVEYFFLEHCYADFLWVELSEELETNPIGINAFKAMDELNMDRAMPIIKISYNS